jgi:hypothetical protein
MNDYMETSPSDGVRERRRATAQQLKGKEWNRQDPQGTMPTRRELCKEDNTVGSNRKSVDVQHGDMRVEGDDNVCVVQLEEKGGESDVIHHMEA